MIFKAISWFGNIWGWQHCKVLVLKPNGGKGQCKSFQPGQCRLTFLSYKYPHSWFLAVPISPSHNRSEQAGLTLWLSIPPWVQWHSPAKCWVPYLCEWLCTPNKISRSWERTGNLAGLGPLKVLVTSRWNWALSAYAASILSDSKILGPVFSFASEEFIF